MRAAFFFAGRGGRVVTNARAPRPRRSRPCDLVLTEGAKAKKRRASKRDWTKAKEQQFLTVLAETCNVTLACAESGVSVSGAYVHRKKNAAFRAAWGEAIAVAYRRLELMLLERSFNGTEKVITRKDGSEERVREYPNNIAIQLLKMHKDTAVEAEREHSPEAVAELREKLRRKLARLKTRMIEEGRVPE